MLEITGLSFRYNKSGPYVLNDASLSLADGETGILLGRNGAGKTTLFGNIIGSLRPEKGKILFDGQDLTAMNRRKRASYVAYVPQDIQFGELTVFDSVLMGRLAYFGLRAGKDDIEKTEEILREMGLSELAHRNVTELSGGERQKTAVARALAQEPKLLVFDEPAGNLDIANEQLLVKEIRRVTREKGITVLTAVHDLNLALELGGKFFLMKEGRVRYTGGSEIITEDAVEDCFGARVKILETDNRKIVINGGE